MIHWPSKRSADAHIDYDLYWTDKLDVGDSILTSTWSMPSASTSLTFVDGGFISPVTKVFLTGGISGEAYILQNAITTVFGSSFTRQASVLVKD
ncbi:hypothetical protein [Bradyrhizobium sp. Tv2a-2]|uniref:phage fiber-tail adaptor protein n=1 Tax=Bradyrhizobium sp. Tv2a-2 TaxID=113395 RepID=UPI0004284F00|nr:hypothetical protein [Bradyrhizobium sp. Tv2a-2]